ncbi:MAG: hypothetical protein H6810_11425 [Phycisphaeraceae bacterium]|nr:MAG: hypothetical protein H6810_11425 [Phycisphaeraceae bacterium]
MPRTRSEAILILSPSRIELARTDRLGRPSEAMWYSPEFWADAEASGYKTLDHWLGRAFTSMGLKKKTPVTVCLSGTSLRTEVSHHAGAGRAVYGHAHATMAEQFDHRDGLYQVAVSRLDARPGIEGDDAWYYISAESDSVLDALVAFVERAGLVCRGITGLGLMHARAVATRLAGMVEAKLVCDVGEHESIVAMGVDHTVPLFRPFNVGLAPFVDAYARVLEQAGAGESLSRARAFVFSHGIPSRDDMIDESLGLSGRSILPVLQPVIQRLAVEIKNTLRFGLNDGAIDSARVELDGLAARVPGLAAALSGYITCEISCGGSSERAHGGAEPSACYVDALRGETLGDNLLRPLRLVRQHHQKLFNKCLRVGAVTAALVLGAEALLAFADIRNTTTELASLRPRLDAVERFNQQSGDAVTLAADLSAVRGAIDERMGDVARWGPGLAVIARSMDERTHLLDCRGIHESGRAWYRLSGEVDLQGPEDRTLGILLDAIEADPMFDAVELESARVETRNSAAVQRFIVRVRLVTQPAAPHSVVLAAPASATAGEGAGP